MATVDVAGEEYTVYADIEAADLYLGGGSHAAAWRALTDDDDKGRYLVTATRTLNRQNWLGDKTDSDQELQWPRTNTGVDGVEDDVIPQDIIDASIEMASALVDGSDVQNEANTAQKIESLKAGSVAISYFRGAEGPTQRFPQIVQELLSKYLGGSSLAITGVATGTSGTSVTENDFGLNRGL